MRAPITDKHLLEMMWERFPEIMKRGAEQPAQQEPVAKYMGKTYRCPIVNLYQDIPVGTLLYTTPAQRKPLTDAQINAFFEGMEPNNGFWLSFARAIEAAHGIKENT